MKKTLLFFVGCLLLFVGASAQTPACAPNMAYASLPPGLYPDSLPVAQGCQFYDVDITFKLPRDTNVSPIGQVFFETFIIDTIIGFPPGGMQYRSDKYPSNTYNVMQSNPNPDTLGCVRIWGTPVQLNVPDTFHITITVLAYVDVISTAQIVTFERDLIVLPCVEDSICFTTMQNQLCEPATVTFAPSSGNVSNGNPNMHYSWNFGNGVTSNLENPSPQIYNAGTYYPYLQIVNDTFGYYISDITINTIDCTDAFNGPDVFWIFKDGNGNTLVPASSPNSNLSLPASTGITNVPVSIGGTYNLEVWDDDVNDFPSNADDGCTDNTGGSGEDIFFNITGAGTFAATQGGLTIQYTVVHPTDTTYCQDTIVVYDVPATPVIVPVPGVNLSKLCVGDTATLSASVPNALVEWYRDGALMGNGIFYKATLSGTYHVVATNISLCKSYSDTIDIEFTPPPAVTVSQIGSNPTVWQANATPPLSNGYFYQWRKAAPPTGTLIGFNQTQACNTYGNYYVTVINPTIQQCSTTVNVGLCIPTAISEAEILADFQIYPNPAQDILNISFDNTTGDKIIISLYDMMGKEMLKQEVTHAGLVQEAISLQGFSHGLYLLHVEAESGIIRRKVVKE